MEERSDRFTAIEDKYAGYTVVDEGGSKIGKVDDLFLDESDQPEYFGVKMGFLGTSSTLIPADITTIDNEQGLIEVSQPKSTVQDGPAFDDDREITPDYENEVRSYYGLGPVESSGSYEETNGHSGAGTTGSTSAGTVGSGMSMGDTETGEFREHDAGDEGVSQSHGDDLAGDDEVEVPVTEEEVVTDKRAVAKEEVRLRKDVVEGTEVVEDDVRREEIDVEDATERGR